MMDTGLTALLLLLLAVVLGSRCKVNVGLLVIAGAVVLGYASGQFPGKQIIGGFSASLFMTLSGVILFFGITQESGCIEFVMRRMIGVFGKQIWMAPVLVLIMGFIVAATGPGRVSAMVFAAAMAVLLTHGTGYHPVMLLVIGNLGTYSGRFSSITSEGILIRSLLEEQGPSISITSLILNTLIGNLVLLLITFVAYKGFCVKALDGIKIECEKEKMRADQVIALISVVVMIFLVTFVNTGAGPASFLISAVLTLLWTGDEKKAVGNVPWNILFLACGVGVLINPIISMDGIDMLANSMSSIMISGTAAGITGVVSAVMSWFSSAIGVVFPTLISTAGAIVSNVGGGIQTVEMVSVIALFASVVGLSPASTGGAITMEACEADEEFNRRYPGDKLLAQLPVWAFITIGVLVVMAFAGAFGWSGQQKLEDMKKHS